MQGRTILEDGTEGKPVARGGMARSCVFLPAELHAGQDGARHAVHRIVGYYRIQPLLCPAGAEATRRLALHRTEHRAPSIRSHDGAGIIASLRWFLQTASNTLQLVCIAWRTA